jgi:hypothetical protein
MPRLWRYRRKFPPKVTPPSAGTRGAEECGWSAARRPLCTSSKLPVLLAKMTVAGLHRSPGFFDSPSVDFPAPQRLYNRLIRLAAASARRRVFEAPHRYSVTRFPILIGSHKLRRLCLRVLSVPRRVGPPVPRCLTGESEERETWTAESLRTARPNEALLLGKQVFEWGAGRTRLRRSTFQVNTLVVRAAGASATPVAPAPSRARTGVGPRQTL